MIHCELGVVGGGNQTKQGGSNSPLLPLELNRAIVQNVPVGFSPPTTPSSQ